MFKFKKVKEVVDKWRETTLARICEDCGGKCCRYKLTKLSRKDALRITGGDLDIRNSAGERMLEKKLFKYETRYIKGVDRCPQLKDGRCMIYEDKPDLCNEFPIVVNHLERTVYVTETDCPAKGHMGALEQQLADLGYLTL